MQLRSSSETQRGTKQDTNTSTKDGDEGALRRRWWSRRHGKSQQRQNIPISNSKHRAGVTHQVREEEKDRKKK